MLRRLLILSVVMVGTIGVFVLAGQAGATAQGSSRATDLPGTDVAKAFITSKLAKGWAPPKTPWGDPDLQGNFTTKDEALTPYERPKAWDGRRIEDITPAELAAAIVERQKTSEADAAVVDQGPPSHFRDSMGAQNSRPWFVIDPADGKIPPMTPAGQALIKPREVHDNIGHADSYKDRSLSDRCVSRGIPSMSPGIYGNSYQILQAPGYVAIRYEMIHETRMIPVDGRSQPNSNLRSYIGNARGRWDGNTLVVETTNFDENVEYRGVSVKDLRLIERFTRIAPHKVEWTVTIDNPQVWTRHWTFSMPLTEDDSQIILEYACHEGNYGLPNILSAARARDKAQQNSQGGR